MRKLVLLFVFVVFILVSKSQFVSHLRWLSFSGKKMQAYDLCTVMLKIMFQPTEAAMAPVTMPKLTSAQLTPLSGTPNVEAFMGGRVPMNGTAVTGLPGVFPGMPDPRFNFLTPQQQYVIAVEQVIRYIGKWVYLIFEMSVF